MLVFDSVPEPLCVHRIVPFDELAPLTVAVPPWQIVWLPPAVAVGCAETLITTSSVLEVHGEFEIVHLSVADDPGTSPVIPEVGDEEVVIVAVPAIFVQVPVPEDAVFPASVAVVTLQRLWSAPALAVVGTSFTVIVPVAFTLPQPPVSGML